MTWWHDDGTGVHGAAEDVRAWWLIPNDATFMVTPSGHALLHYLAAVESVSKP